MERTVLHVDCNKFYASVECLHRPELRDKPVAVGGSTESRHGIILTKNEIASRYGERLHSRLLGCFRVIPFVGEDIRLQKLYSK